MNAPDEILSDLPWSFAEDTPSNLDDFVAAVKVAPLPCGPA
jgi:hypothetical protein